MSASRIVAVAAVLAMLTLTISCGGPKPATTTASPHPGTPVSAAYDRFLGWWSSDQSLLSMVHIYRSGPAYALGGLIEGPLHSRHGALSGTLNAQMGQVEFRLSADGKRLLTRWTRKGKLIERAWYMPATKGDVDGFITQGIYNDLSFAINGWCDKHGHYPPASALLPHGAIGKHLRPWPTNPYTGKPIVAGSGPGDYLYRLSKGGYTLTYFEPNGKGTIASGPEPSSSPSP